MDREAIYSAFFNVVSATADFKTSSRKLKHWNDVSDSHRQPALFQVQIGETSIRTKGFPTKWIFNVKLYLYVQAINDDSPTGPVINPLLDKICNLLEPKPGVTITLGIPGVSHCWIEGNIETDEGALGRQAVAIIPISILVV